MPPLRAGILAMVTYYFFVLGDDGHVRAREQFDCYDEADACNTARVHAANHDVEVWCGAMRVAIVKRDGTVERTLR
jgi:hypothetical protein